jgi:hypothetical protein
MHSTDIKVVYCALCDLQFIIEWQISENIICASSSNLN